MIQGSGGCDYLGNTPAVARASYIDGRVVDAYDQGRTITAALDRLGEHAEFGQLATRGLIENAVRRLLKAMAAEGNSQSA